MIDLTDPGGRLSRGSAAISSEALAAAAIWVARAPGPGKQNEPGKEPRVPGNPGQRASINNPSHWGTKQEALAGARQLGPWGGIGVVLGEHPEHFPGYTLVGVDCDACRDAANGRLEEWAIDIVRDFGTWTDISPSETGVKLICAVPTSELRELDQWFVKDDGERRHKFEWRQAKREGEKKSSGIELHFAGYFTVTDQPFPDAKANALKAKWPRAAPPVPQEIRVVPASQIYNLWRYTGPKFEKSAPARRKGSKDSRDDAADRRRGREIIDDAVRKVEQSDGRRNDALNEAAFTVGGALEAMGVAAGAAEETEVAERLFEAIPGDGRDLQKDRDTIRNGIKDGRRRPIDLGTKAADVEAAIDDLNQRFALVKEGSKVIIFEETPAIDSGQRGYHRIDPGAFKLMFANRYVGGGRRRRETIAEAWLAHPRRRQCLGGVVFDPSGRARDDQLNLWSGFAIEPRPGEWGLLRDHIRAILCRDDPKLFDYVLKWMARLVQQPGERGETVIVMRGPEGAGKGTLGNALMEIAGKHGQHISSAHHLVGHFNAHLQNCVFLFADEAFFAGDRQNVGNLKRLVTEKELTVEAKFADAIQANNLLHIMMASNEKWVVPAGLEARRFAVLDVSPDRVRDFDYFAAIEDELRHGGLQAMLHDLMNLDIGGWNWRDIPDSAGLQEQKKLSLDLEHQWWEEVLQRGYVHQSKYGLTELHRWSDWVTNDLLHTSYMVFANIRRARTTSREQLGKFVSRMATRPGATKTPRGRSLPTGEVLDRSGPRLVLEERKNGYSFGTWDEARRRFVEVTGLTGISWEGETDKQLELDDVDRVNPVQKS